MDNEDMNNQEEQFFTFPEENVEKIIQHFKIDMGNEIFESLDIDYLVSEFKIENKNFFEEDNLYHMSDKQLFLWIQHQVDKEFDKALLKLVDDGIVNMGFDVEKNDFVFTLKNKPKN